MFGCLVVPEIIFERCRPRAKRPGLPMEKGDFGKKQRARSDLASLGEFVDHESEEIFDDVPDFHRQVKAAFLTLTPTQIVRETTLDPDAFKNTPVIPSGARRTARRSRGISRPASIIRRSRCRRGGCPECVLAYVMSGSSTKTFRTIRTIMPVVRRRCF